MRICILLPLFLAPIFSLFSKPLSSKEIRTEAKIIDRILDEAHAKANVKVPEKIDEALLARRLYLKIAGRIPTHDEITSFLSDKSGNKKSILVENLIESSAHKSNMFNWWADLLRIKTRMRGGNQIGAGQLYVHWIKDQIEKNIPFDEMAFNLITAEGYPWENGAVGYYLRDAGMPLDNMSNTTQIFLGTQMVCAQCHNHPFDRWTQMEYYQMASYTYGITSSRGGDLQSKIRKQFEAQTKNLSEKYKKKKLATKEAANLRKSVQEMLRPLRYGATHSNKNLKLPHDYQYDDGKPNTLVSSSPIFGAEIKPNVEESKVIAYGNWLSSNENPRFTKVIANRMWKKVFGRGLVEPLDDWRDDTQASIPELMDHLENLMIRVDYDLKEFQKVLFQVNSFENSSPAYTPNIETAYLFEAPLLERMSAEQIWDSLVTLSIPDADERKANPQIIENRLKNFKNYQDSMYSMEGKDILKLARTGTKASKEINDEMEKIQNNLREAQAADDRESVARLRREYGKLRIQQRTVFAKLIMGPNFNVSSLYGYEKKKPTDNRWKKYNSQIYRASELQTPAQPGHFLQEFGQSDREVADNSNRDASVPQALTLLNGTFYGSIFNKLSPLMVKLGDAKTPKQKINVLFLSILNRPPTKEELVSCLNELSSSVKFPSLNKLKIPEYFSKEKKNALQKNFEKQLAQNEFNLRKEYFSIAWSLFNTRQFSFIQ